MNVAALVSLFSGFLAFVLALGQIAVRKREVRNKILAALFVCVGILQWNAALVSSGFVFEHPYLFRIHTPFAYFIGPLLFLLYLSFLKEDWRFRARHFWHFALVLLCIVAMIPYHLKTLAEKRVLVDNLLIHYDPSFYDYVAFGAMLQILVYVGVLVFKFEPFWRWGSLKKDLNARVLLVLLGLILLAVIVGMAILLHRAADMFGYSGYVVCLILIMSYLVGQRYPEFFQQLQHSLQKEKYARSLLGGLDLQTVRAQLKKLMEEDKLYMRDDLTLADLAARTDLTTHQLSEYLNAILGKSFFNYVNSLRVHHVCEQLIHEPEQAVLTIAYAAGFNSKSSFHTAFTRQMGKTPSQYRKVYSKG